MEARLNTGQQEPLPHQGLFDWLNRGHQGLLDWMMANPPIPGWNGVPYQGGPMAGGRIRRPGQSQFDPNLERWREQIWPRYPNGPRVRAYDDEVRRANAQQWSSYE